MFTFSPEGVVSIFKAEGYARKKEGIFLVPFFLVLIPFGLHGLRFDPEYGSNTVLRNVNNAFLTLIGLRLCAKS
jgi:hypothetical protein